MPNTNACGNRQRAVPGIDDSSLLRGRVGSPFVSSSFNETHSKEREFFGRMCVARPYSTVSRSRRSR
jgi:hypothetical protein